MLKNGTYPNRISHRDWDFHRTHNRDILSGAVAYPTFPDSYSSDNGLVVPNQNSEDPSFTPPVAPIPYGCTDEAQADIATDLNLQIHSPQTLENVTHANAKGGYGIRDALNAAVGLGWITNYFNIQAIAPLDFFDAIRLAMQSGIPERRSVTIGTPWFPSWEEACNAGTYVMPAPTLQELQNINNYTWHNHAIKGWHAVNGVQVLMDKSWQGKGIGQNGFIAFDRATINTVMSIAGTVAYIVTNEGGTTPVTISVSMWQYAQSIMADLLSSLGFYY